MSDIDPVHKGVRSAEAAKGSDINEDDQNALCCVDNELEILGEANDGGKVIVVAENRDDDVGEQAILRSRRVPAYVKDLLARHELSHGIGHAVDGVLGELSSTKEFRDLYFKERATAELSSRKLRTGSLGYYLQPGYGPRRPLRNCLPKRSWITSSIGTRHYISRIRGI